MTTIAHSPGPWFVHCAIDEVAGTAVMAPGEQGNYIVCCCDDEPYSEINAANARLIAAAPEMLTALRLALIANERVLRSKDEPEWVRHSRDAIAKAVAA